MAPGHWQPNVMPFGLCGAPGTFQEFINAILRDLIAGGLVLAYLNNILIATPDDPILHREIVHKVLDRLAEHDLFLKPEKCVFEQRTVAYLGLIIGEGQVRMDPHKVEAVRTWPIPQNLHELRVFMGLIGWLRPFLHGFAHKAKPLTDLTRKGQPFNWTDTCQDAFETLKSLATSEPALVQPDLERPFELEVDASNFTTGAVLIQRDDDGKPHPVAYLSQTLNQAERGYNIMDKELLAVM